MIRTFTTPQSIIKATEGITDHNVEDTLDDCQLTQDLIEEFKDVTFKAPDSAVERAMAYSASHKVQPSNVMKDGNIAFLN